MTNFNSWLDPLNTLKPNQTIVEASSGNTGISVAFISSLLGHPCKIIMPSDMSEERKKYIKLFGGELIEVAAGDFKAAIKLRNELATKNDWFNVNQFHNKLLTKSNTLKVHYMNHSWNIEHTHLHVINYCYNTTTEKHMTIKELFKVPDNDT